ncbi:Serine/threonine-protein phosphatase 6 regulatory ankyrin repeat subunit A [Thelohanellus kitauei]|uniref:Serine/threonine-protein phosphatase 6 regulatory ankyrin repeat subunit A n=1 Tax=Thelohanellus kitauei TaxID=669202 RepID=A0A0C2MGF2_THEKT|nr:Serine/threonine-protein phosphatase 6 regulatory ankyrin repeat subunit A [Thelohanellus kitauei]
MRRNNSLLELLIKFGARTDQRTSLGKTAAHFAADSGSVPCLKTLFKHNADLTLADNSNYTPLHYASYKGVTCLNIGFPDIVTFIIKKIGKEHILDGNSFSPIHCAILNQSLDCLKSLIKGLETVPVISDEQGRTPLHLACSLDDTLIVDALIMTGENLNSVDHSGLTPLHVAAKNHNPSILEFLLASNVDLSMTDNEGNTALHIACLEEIEDNALLISKKMSKEQFEIKNKNGKSALDVCKSSDLNWDISHIQKTK